MRVQITTHDLEILSSVNFHETMGLFGSPQAQRVHIWAILLPSSLPAFFLFKNIYLAIRHLSVIRIFFFFT